MSGTILIVVFAVLVLAILVLPLVTQARQNTQRDAEPRATMLREQTERDIALEDEKAAIRTAKDTGTDQRQLGYRRGAR
ncbi:hypothetical protein DEI93_09515 [Curtobacterium sp. MCBD17_035]|uniref:hypothetical protein n=1 Tax=Curtobacterium sp. MCBD17_035 TaxID=2175673 RepID=UPI0011B7604A|nr:hypothetical protein [Curtobacterium sp. MCBD17_035]WIB66232.1 hypothetical protein DEI93_09515 [Curtobacterium sp. MCBD17_035]